MASTEATVEALDVRPIDAAHSDAVWPLSIEAGWNQNVADWRFMLGAGRGFGCVGPDGKWQASSLVLPLGQKLAWISMVLVTRGRRGGGVGTGLLRHCIEEVLSAGAVAAISTRYHAGTSMRRRTRRFLLLPASPCGCSRRPTSPGSLFTIGR